MIHFIKTYSWLLIPLLLWSGIKSNSVIYKTNQYTISINHPGETAPIEVFIHQILDKNALPIEYYMDVPSVICLEKVCKVIPVRLFWNNLGEYQKYELEKGATLEKYKADVFEPQDYSKLQNILSDDDSPFKEVYYNEILTVVDENVENDVDAVSGATALVLDEEDTVPGAALGCYTLWHWANGEIIDEIKKLTGKVLSDSQLIRALTDKNRKYYSIAIKELENRKNISNVLITTIIDEASIDDSVVKSTFKYLEKSSSKVYLNATKAIFSNGKKIQKLAAIRSLRYSKHKAKSSYFNELSNQISSLKSFQEIAVFLDLMESKNPNSKTVIQNTVPLLKSDFIIARRAYWFLKNQKLTSSQEKLVKEFHRKHQNSL